MSKKIWWLVAAPVVILVLAVGGAFVYTRTDPEVDRLSVDDAPTTAPGGTGEAGAGEAGDGRYQVAAGSQAGYRVEEILFGQSTTAVGRTGEIEGAVEVDGDEVKAATFTVQMVTVASDKSQRDNQFNNRIMATSEFPTSTFVLTEPIDLGGEPGDGTSGTFEATGDLTLRGTTRSVTFDVEVKAASGTFNVAGSIPVNFPEWDIPNPSGGPAEVGDDGELEFLLVLAD